MALTIPNEKTSLYTLVSGNDNEESIILLHGGPGVPEDMDPLISRLSKIYRVIYFH